MKIEIEKIIELALEAGYAILDIYHSGDLSVEIKSDKSPLTKADKLSHDIISNGLKNFYPDIPILSEEGKEIPYSVRKNWDTFWLVDPLDGTKEFIKHNGEFTVNIALIENQMPVLGVVYAPALGQMYYGQKGIGAFKKYVKGEAQRISVNTNLTDGLIAVRSRSHHSPEEVEIFRKYNITEEILVGSSLKFCMLAEGKAHLYYRHGPTWEWDTAAGHAIFEAANSNSFYKAEKLNYNKSNLLNSSFILAPVTG